jgi:hypothetical protein|tara:strand:- start:779 stop:1030 length:252 start_codon:yes stop_codon:yes gene_type:complete
VQPLDPKRYGLTPRTKLVKLDNAIGIIIDRKSRIIMKDGNKILDQANTIQTIENSPIVLFTSAPVCSKTKNYLLENNISIKNL